MPIVCVSFYGLTIHWEISQKTFMYIADLKSSIRTTLKNAPSSLEQQGVAHFSSPKKYKKKHLRYLFKLFVKF